MAAPTIYEDRGGVRWLDLGDDELVAIEPGEGLLRVAKDKWPTLTKKDVEAEFGTLVEIVRPAGDEHK